MTVGVELTKTTSAGSAAALASPETLSGTPALAAVLSSTYTKIACSNGSIAARFLVARHDSVFFNSLSLTHALIFFFS